MKFFALAFLFVAGSAVAQDYEREKRWAAEVEPNLVVGDAVQLTLPSGRSFLGIFAGNKNSKPAILLVHGVGVHPDHSIIGILRTALADKGHATLSIQMPVLRSDAANDEYAPLFPDAVARIQAGAEWLAQRGHVHPVLLSHSMGSRMAAVYFERTADAPFSAWVCMGLSGSFGRLGNLKGPVLDIYGERDLPNVLRGEWRRKLAIAGVAGSRQVKVDGADHFFNGREKELAAEIERLLAELK